ncbi:hypothetical protein PAMA_020400 [Pampus argenteus]
MILLPVTYSLVFVLGLSLNGALLWCVSCRTRRRSSTDIYLTNLAVADLLYVLALPPLIISNAMGDLWPFGNIICKAVRFCFFANIHCSMMFLACASVHRFVGVCFPIAAVRIRTRKLALFASGAADSIYNARAARMRNKSLRTLMVVCLLFVLCFGPYHIARTVYLFVRVYMPEDCDLLNVVMISFKVLKPVVSFNCCANPFLYFWGADRHRQKLRAWLRSSKQRVQPACPKDGGQQSS